MGLNLNETKMEIIFQLRLRISFIFVLFYDYNSVLSGNYCGKRK